MRKLLIGLFIIVTLLQADDVLFKQGSKSIGINTGTGNLDIGVTKNYYILGVKGDYFVYDNLSVGIGISVWLGNDPTLIEVNVPVTYYFETDWSIYPYLGLFYKYSFYNGDYVDLSYNSIGARAGISYKIRKGYIGVGVVTEYNIDIGENYINPEIFAGIVF